MGKETAGLNKKSFSMFFGGKRFTRVVFVGTDKYTQRKIRKALSGAPFALSFINDFEKAKEWLVGESYS